MHSVQEHCGLVRCAGQETSGRRARKRSPPPATPRAEEILDKEIEDLIAERQEARKAKNFARADEIRDELLAKGIILKDTREGVKWKRA